jgi:molybdopterin molybdotransferase
MPEYFVHLDKDDPPNDLVLATGGPDDLRREKLTPTICIRMACGRRSSGIGALRRRIGDVRQSLPAARSVRLAPAENNLLINPRHPDFAKVAIDPPQPLLCDPSHVSDFCSNPHSNFRSPPGTLTLEYHRCMSPSSTKAGVVTFEKARRIVEDHAAKLMAECRRSNQTETVDLLLARGRVLSEDIFADRDFPPFPRATRDGYAVCAADLEYVPAHLEVIGEIKAGDSPETSGRSLAITPGHAVSIMTGAPLPAGADAVVMIEYTKITGDRVEIERRAKSGENFVPCGTEAHAGQLLIERGSRLDHAMIALSAAVGNAHVQVFRKPRVAVLATGDEVVEINVSPGPAQIRNSNTYSLAAQIEEAGAEPVRLPIAPDQPARLRELIEEGLQCDLLLITGGVSMGKYDLVEQVLGELRAEFYFTGAHIQPGKPIVFGKCDANTPVRERTFPVETTPASSHTKYFFGLPGNPVSTTVTFQLFVQPTIAALTGARAEPLVFLKARLKSEVGVKTGLTRFLPATISGEFENAEVELAAWQGSGDIAALARANCYLVIPPDRGRIEAGERVSILMG